MARTALMIAAQTGHLDVVQALVAAKAEVNAKAASGATALGVASEQGHLDVVQALVAANADVNAKAANGATAMMQASQNGHLEVMRGLGRRERRRERQENRWRHGVDGCLRKWPPGCGAGLGRLERRCERQGGQWRNGVEFGDKGRLRGDSAAPESVASPVNK